MDEIALVDYDPRWPDLFELEAARLRRILPSGLITRVEHFGSTAIPGLPAKPIIDLLVGVNSLAAARRDTLAPLATLGYAFWSDDPDPSRMFFVRGLPPNGPRTHHIHMVALDSPFWERLRFRDYLRAHSDEALRYAQLKRELAAQFSGDREAYTDGKTEYVASVMRKADAASAADPA